MEAEVDAIPPDQGDDASARGDIVQEIIAIVRQGRERVAARAAEFFG